MIKGIHHISMKCGTAEELAKVREFYIELLGLKVIREWAEGMMIDTGNGLLEIFTNADGTHCLGAIRHMALLTDDVDEIAAKVKAAGYDLFIEPNNKDIPSDPVYPIRMAFCYGPLGEQVEFYMERNYIQEALAHYNITVPEIELLRHNENLTYRVGNEYLLQIHEPVEGFSTDFFYEGVERIEIYKAELAFQAHLKKQGMQIREAIENCYGERITKLQDGTYVTVSKWLEGESLDKLELNAEICYQIGEMLAHLHQKAKGFRVSPVKSYGKQHCECTKKRIQALENQGLSAELSAIMQKCCDCAGAVLENARDDFQMIHGDLSASNILQTPEGLVPIDFSFFGMGHPMYDLVVLFGNIGGSLVCRQQMAEGYRDAGGTIRYDVLDACFVLTLLDCLGIHYEQWSKQEWFAPRMQRWHQENLKPYVQGERIYADDFYLLHVQS